MQTNRLADVYRDACAKVLPLDVCKPSHLHHSFFLKYNNSKYLSTVGGLA